MDGCGPHLATWHQVLGVLEQPPGTEIGTAEFREAINLVFRTYTGMRLSGRYAVTAVRGDMPGVLSVIELERDLAALKTMIPLVQQTGTGRWHFPMTTKTLRQLERVAVPPDTRSTGRRAQKRKEEEHAGFSLRWW